MSQILRFSSGLELANLVVSSDLLNHSWAAIWNLYIETSQQEGLSSSSSPSVGFKVYEQPNCTIIAFITWPACSKDYIQGGGDLISSSTKDTFPDLFEFLCTKDNPHVSINKAALDLFASIRGSLPYLKSQIDNWKPLIITGNSLGGSVASLFTLSLLEKHNFRTTKPPLCITFGSPLIGDDGLQEAISKYPTWNSCFLHVVSDQDPVPRLLISTHNPIGSDSQTNVYKPFGTFLLCSELGYACFECSQTILDLLMATYSKGPENQTPNNIYEFYGIFVEHLKCKIICKDTTWLVKWSTKSLHASIITQLEAIGLVSPQQHQNIDINTVITKTEKQETELEMFKKQDLHLKGLSEIKVNMAYLEWYKKYFKDKGIGYYDSYKILSGSSDHHIANRKKILTTYWEGKVDELLKRPLEESAHERWLFAGTSYRRMIEPLDIAEYYNKGLKDYVNQGRSKHYKQLEQWFEEMEKPASVTDYFKKENMASRLTDDSCFWAHVEEARISCNLLSSRESSIREKESSKHNLIEFENYVLCLMKNYAVSPEIFLPQSSFMRWWKEYEVIIIKEIMGTSYTSRLTDLMKKRSYHNYATGSLEIF